MNRFASSWKPQAFVSSAALIHVRRHNSSTHQNTGVASSLPPPPPPLGVFVKTSKPARQFSVELSKIRSDLRRSTTATATWHQLRGESIAALRNSPLEFVQGLDVRLVSQYLSLLEQLAIPGDDAGVQSAASWLRHQIASASDMAEQAQRLPIHNLAQCLLSLTRVRYEDAAQLLMMATPLIRHSLGDANTTTVGILLDCALFASHGEGCIIPLVADLLTPLELRSTSLSATEALQIRVSSGGNRQAFLSDSCGASCLRASSDGQHVASRCSRNVLHCAACSITIGIIGRRTLFSRLCSKNCREEVDLHSSAELVSSMLRAYASLNRDQYQEMTGPGEIGIATERIIGLLQRVMQVFDPASLSLEAFCSLYGAASSAQRSSLHYRNPPSSVTSSPSRKLLPQCFDDSLLAASNETNIAWTTMTLLHLLPALAASPTHLPLLVRLCSLRIEELLNHALADGGSAGAGAAAVAGRTTTVGISSSDLLPLLYPDVVEANETQLRKLLLLDGAWSASSMFHIVVELATKPTSKVARSLLRDVASKVCPLISTTTPTQLSVVAGCYGRMNVRHDELCEQISSRTSLLVEELTIHQITVILSSLSAVEYRNNRAFLDSAHRLRLLCHTANEVQITNLIASFARSMVWNFNLFASMADRAFVLREGLAPVQMITIMSAFSRVGFSHDEFVSFAVSKLKHRIASTAASAGSQSSSKSSLSLNDCVQLAFTASLTKLWTVELFEELAERFILEQQKMDAAQLSEALFSFARVGLKQHRIFEETSLRALAVAPSCPPLAMAHMVQAYSHVGRRNEEMFGVFSDRLLAARETFPAVVIAAILDGFAQLGIEDDRLFIEMVPRVRHVATYGCSQDVANTVRAYSTAKLWHYKLFVRLAERAIQIKSECRSLDGFAQLGIEDDRLFIEMVPRVRHVATYGCSQDVANTVRAYSTAKLWHYKLFVRLAERAIQIKSECRSQDMIDILSSYARVEMRYEKLFVEFAPKLQTLAHIFTPTDIHALVCAYGKVKVFEAALLSTLSDRVVDLMDVFDDASLDEVMSTLREASVGGQDALEQAFEKRTKNRQANDASAAS
ncbi:Hypothetical protein, putative [Bodo saltans]|uniref:RNA-editing substrate-binding complex 6 protein domain-containing protein n=1 Tax=Bodo saltans TaxID=75058 RepID=A0A0S4IRR5_BODSA|nr:Hypothetical protein, putative [Bodo saltans]|eukprot:CUG03406.1 Hypothetical protein, putative [Bodo saltans]